MVSVEFGPWGHVNVCFLKTYLVLKTAYSFEQICKNGDNKNVLKGMKKERKNHSYSPNYFN